jgi:hypothetical protein
MAKRKTSASAVVAAASLAGRALGTVAGRVDRLKANHPDPVAEAGQALAKGKAEVVARTDAARKSSQKAARKARRAGSKAVASATKATKKLTKRVTKAVAKARKTVSRRAARLKR